MLIDSALASRPEVAQITYNVLRKYTGRMRLDAAQGEDDLPASSPG